ncbi:hypothetical protein AB0I94_08890 [Streptomyces sp. NPDC050147]|uniref:hypothetical protein n=1 Tax=Streptomyces sp. NPDC050147 TaxID=3155513 RepID=UPI0034241B43
MTLNPATAAIIGTTLGAIASISGALLTQHATNRRERENRVWSRRMAVYEDAMITVHRLAELRSELSRTGTWPDGTGAAVTDSHALAARLEIYATTEVLDAHLDTFTAMRAWMHAWEEWDNQEEGHPRVSQSDGLWREFIRCVDASVESDRQFWIILRKEVRGSKGETRLP